MANLKDAVQFALCVAMGIVYILKPLLDFLDGVQPLSPVLEAAVALLTISLLPLYLIFIIVMQLLVAPAPAVLAAPGAARTFACYVCIMVSAFLAVLALALVALMFLAGGELPWAWGAPPRRMDALF